jgi:AcrR family transcriptional regulator
VEACQKGFMRQSNASRTARTRRALLLAARKNFVDAGFAGASTPDIVREAEVTRGALYHHFTDKTDLFRAVHRAEAEAVALLIKAATANSTSPRAALLDGADAYFAAMAEPGRALLMLIEAPAVLSPDELAAIDRETGGGELLDGLKAIASDRLRDDTELEALASLLSAAFDRAALNVARGGAPDVARRAIRVLLEGLIG